MTAGANDDPCITATAGSDSELFEIGLLWVIEMASLEAGSVSHQDILLLPLTCGVLTITGMGYIDSENWLTSGGFL